MYQAVSDQMGDIARAQVATPGGDTGTITIERDSTTPKSLQPWIVICWDDPINTMDYVVEVFQKLFGFPRAKAMTHMLQVHVQGKSILVTGPREKCEFDAERLGSCGLTASIDEA